ncbi:MAG: hypothetical protein PHU58_07050 [Prevotella sp.]|nr:hypothetical protein [Prevotella sp.]
MLINIINQLKTGKIKNVVAYGAGALPATPYVVVRIQKDPLERGRLIRLFVHFAPGSNIFLEDYVLDDLSTLLNGFTFQTRHGNTQKVEFIDDYGEVVPDNDDKSISMERSFLVPGKLF